MSLIIDFRVAFDDMEKAYGFLAALDYRRMSDPRFRPKVSTCAAFPGDGLVPYDVADAAGIRTMRLTADELAQLGAMIARIEASRPSEAASIRKEAPTRVGDLIKARRRWLTSGRHEDH